jgi:hypothetical protein
VRATTEENAASARAYGPYVRHILEMADMISGGISKQFPARERLGTLRSG